MPLYFFLFFLLIFGSTHAEEEKAPQMCSAEKEEFVETHHEIKIGEQLLAYQATAGNYLLKDEKGVPKASIFFISFSKTNGDKNEKRPITFCFNGGPGSSSLWLNIGLLGPRRIQLAENGSALAPYTLVDNAATLLDKTDLVFIDPISTGYSRAIPPEDAKNYYSLERDVGVMADFIRLYITKHEKWNSPKFLVGESYGTARAVSLAQHLFEKYYVNVNGIILISCALNYQLFAFLPGNDLPYALTLPTYTATAWFHKKLSPELQGDFQKALAESKAYAAKGYSEALFKGDRLPLEEKKQAAIQLARLTGLPAEYWEKSRLRVDLCHFNKELLRSQSLVIGRFDSSLTGIESDTIADTYSDDPTIKTIFGPFTGAFNQYLETELNCKRSEPYNVLLRLPTWDFGANNKYMNVTGTLSSLITKFPYLSIFAASGFYDLATPFYTTDYTFNHLGLDPTMTKSVTVKTYPGGHMMYLYEPSLVQLSNDLKNYYEEALKPPLNDTK